jgi:hypothetical protein
LKAERVFDSLYPTGEKAKRDIIDYIEMFYNSKRSIRILAISAQTILKK